MPEGTECAPMWGRLLTADEVANYLRCHVSTVYDLVSRGRLKGFSLTGNIDKNKRGKKGLRILSSSVDDLVAGGLNEMAGTVRVEPNPPPPEPVGVALPLPPEPWAMPPARRRGSRVVLPLPA